MPSSQLSDLKTTLKLKQATCFDHHVVLMRPHYKSKKRRLTVESSFDITSLGNFCTYNEVGAYVKNLEL
jgi:hypothetical protein